MVPGSPDARSTHSEEEKTMLISRVILSGLVVAAIAPVSAAQPFTAEEFERLHREIRPRPSESTWAEISWGYDLHKARRKAAQEGKPLCVWRMAGDPTGTC